VNVTQELDRFVGRRLGEADLPESFTLYDIYSWNDAWTFGGDGAPRDRRSNISWGGQGKLAPYVDLRDVLMRIREVGTAGGTDFSAEIAALQAVRDGELTELALRLDAMVDAIHGAVDELEAAGC
jgi:hypothetical protein